MERVLFAPRELPPLPPDVAQDPSAYVQWIRQHEGQRADAGGRRERPTLHLVMPAHQAAGGDVDQTLEGLRRQRSRAWTLTILTPSPDDVEGAVRRTLPLWLRRRVRAIAEPGLAMPGALGAQLRAARDGGTALIHPGDVWAPDAVGLIAAALNPTGVVYADEDVPIAADGLRAPRFKPAYSPDFLLASGYLGRPMAMGWMVAQRLPPLVATSDIDLDHECALAACEIADSVEHIAEVLCHRPQLPAPPLPQPNADHVVAALQRRGQTADVLPDDRWGTYRVVRRPPVDCPVSIIVPFRDEPRFLRTCVDSVTSTISGHDVELVLVDNGSSDPEVLTLVEHLGARADVTIISDRRPFNWAQLNNAAAGAARGDVLVFLNNDIEAHRDGWLTALVGHALRPDVGAVGARLLYPDRRVQHCGVVIGLIGAAGHPLVGLPEHEPGYLHMAVTTRECAAVTGACLATSRKVFDQLAGFDETLGVDLNDVDYCLRAGRAGLRTIYEPASELIHYESPSRGTAGGAGDIVNFIERWRDYISAGDPFFNVHLTRTDPFCRLATPHEEERWKEWHATLMTA